MKALSITFLLSILYSLSFAQSPIVFILDASGSMWGKIEGTFKKDIATTVLSDAVKEIPDGQPISLVAYGHRQKSDCQDVAFLASLDNQDKSVIVEAMKGIKPLGKTPLAYAAIVVIDKLRQAQKKATIILITDGIESCDGDLCAVVRAARAEGIDFRLHLVGFGLQEQESEALRCAAQAGGGQYYDAADAEGLSSVLTEATKATVDAPPANFTLYAVKNGKAIDAYVKVLSGSQKEMVTAARTYGDTAAMFLPAGEYELEVKPLENSDVDAITVTQVVSQKGKAVHRTVSFDAGKIAVQSTNNGEGWDAVVKIFKAGSNKTVAGGRTYGRPTSYELDPGTYDLRLEAMKIEGSGQQHRIAGISVSGNATQELTHDFKSGAARIGVRNASGLVDAVVKIKDAQTGKPVAGGRTYTASSSNPKEFLLTPGNYEVTLTVAGDYSGRNKSVTIQVEEGQTVERMVEVE